MPQELDDIMSGQGAAASASDTQEQGQPRDEHGRYAGKSEGHEQEQAQQPETEQVQEQSAMVPIQTLDARLAKADEKYTALEAQFQQTQRQLQQFLSQQQRQPAQEPAPVPDWLENPAGFVQHNARELITPIQDDFNNRLLVIARQTAEWQYGDKLQPALTAFDSAVASGQVDQRDVQRVYQSPNPFHEAVQWHSRTSVLSRLGDDPDAYIEAEVQRRLTAANGQPQPLTPPPAPSNGRTVMPSDFATTRNSGSRTAPLHGGPKPLSEIMNR